MAKAEKVPEKLPNPDIGVKIAGLLGQEFASLLGGTPPTGELTRIGNTITTYLDVADPQRREKLVKAVLSGIPPDQHFSALAHLPPDLGQYIDISQRSFDIKQLQDATTLSLVLHNPEVAKRTFGLTDGGAESLGELAGVEVRQGEKKDMIPAVAEVMAGIVRRVNAGELELTLDDFTKFIQSTDIRTRGLPFELLLSVAEAYKGEAQNIDDFIDKAVLFMGVYRPGTDRLEGRQYWWDNNIAHVIKAYHNIGFIRAGEALQYWMGRSENLEQVVQARMRQMSQAPGDFQKQLDRSYFYQADYRFLDQFAIASMSIKEDDGMPFPRIKNPKLEEMRKRMPQAFGRIVRAHFDDTIYDLSDRNTLLFARRLFLSCIGSLNREELSDYLAKIQAVKSPQERQVVEQRLKRIGESLLINWNSMETWDDVKKVLGPQEPVVQS